ncbi:MAG: right-handed parallel beta-helix repeat-containing protein [Bacteroidales bacterium]|nr:right-handed parallel beta-helix repeat-containing protein [Bacteroidales bacterium]
MKKKLIIQRLMLLRVNKVSFFLCLLFTSLSVNSQVLFTHTVTDDFNKGQYNDMNTTSNAVTLPNQVSSMNNWVTTTVLPQTLAGHKLASFNNRFFYVVGGNNGVSNTASVYRATAQTTGVGSWTSVNSLPLPVRDHAVVTGTNSIYVLGGRDGSTIYNTIYTASLGLTGGLGTWTTSSVNLPENLWGHTAVYCNGYIYVAGGSITASPTSARSNVYYAKVNQDNTLSAFSAATSLPQPLNGHTMLANGNDIYIIGGFTSGGTKVNTVYKATSANDGSLGVWALETSIPEALSNHASVIINGVITVTGGENATTLINKTYYADVNQTPLIWITGTDKYEYTKDGIAYANNGQLIYSGGEDLSGTPIHNSRYAPFTLSSNRKLKGQFISNSFTELGAERYITELIINSTIQSGASIQISYRLADEDKIWSNWSAPVSGTPIPVADSGRYVQYKVDFTSDGTANATMNDLNLSTPGTQLAGNLNAIPTFTKAASPYWVTDNITFTSGTHTFEAGTVLLFLPQKTMTVGTANIICNGNSADSVYFTGYTDEQGLWGGINFNNTSSSGVSSQFYYTSISNAGYGTFAANLYCDGTSEPLLNNCNIFGSTANGVRLNNAHINIQSSKIHSNVTNGLSLTTSNPTFINCNIYNNAAAGVYLSATTSNPTYSGTSITGNLYAIHYGDPNSNFYQPSGSPTLTGNTYNGVVLNGGNITSSNKTWQTITYDYILLGNINIYGGWSATRRLTIEPGNTIKFVSGTSIYASTSSNGFGELYAIGSASQPIKFTSWDGTSGGWSGIQVRYSESFQNPSVFDYCTIENGNDFNVLAVGSGNITLLNCTIQNAVQDGLRFDDAKGQVEGCIIKNNGRYGLYLTNVSTPAITQNHFLNNNNYPLFINTPNSNHVLSNNTYSGNTPNLIGYQGGELTASRTLFFDNIPYHIINNLIVRMNWGNTNLLTISPGNTLLFNPGTELRIGNASNGYGSILAAGNDTMPITFKSYNDTIGGWNGIWMTGQSNQAASLYKYCIIEQGNVYNMFFENTTLHELENCTIKNGLNDGVRISGTTLSLKSNLFENNGAYPLQLLNWTSVINPVNNTYTGNTLNYIAMPGGTCSANYTLRNDGVPYHFLDNLTIRQSFSVANVLTIEPGNILNFNPGKILEIGNASNGFGSINATGTPSMPIIFKAFGDTAGGWNGIHFTSASNQKYSVLKHCVVEQGNVRNIYCDNSNQPSIKNCIIRNAANVGLRMLNAAIDTVYNTTITDNGGYGVYLTGTSTLRLGNDTAYTCNIFNNAGLYQISNLSASNVNARYNYWGTNDSAMVAQRIFDKYDSTACGIVYFTDFATVPALPTDTIHMSGTVKYANTAETPLENAAMVIHSWGTVPYASTTTNTQGIYVFDSIPSGSYLLSATPFSGWGGVNATDALIILNHFSQTDTLTGMPYAAADVNLSTTINATDAMLVLKRFANLISDFPAGDYLQHSENISSNGVEVINNIKMLCFGDVNASYDPSNPKSSDINLISESILSLPSFTETYIPVKVKSGISTGAISLGFYYPEQYIEILDVTMNGSNNNFYYTAGNGLLKLAWCSNSPLSVDADSVLLNFKIKTLDMSSLTAPVNFILYEHSELADAYAQVIQGITLEMPEIISTATGITEMNTGNTFSCYPNPFSGEAVITFEMNEAGPATLTLYNALGARIASLFSGNIDSGSHQIDLKFDAFSKGIYFLKLETVSGSSVLKVVALD